MAEPLQRGPRPEELWPTIEGYEISEVIGRGSSGVVYRARQLSVEREVAIKIVHERLAHEPRVVRRLQREARTTARLAHPHIVSAVDMGETSGRWWYAMEYVDGPSLAERLRAEGKIREREALRLFIPLCEALEHLWEHGVVHRDIKPANILIDRASGARLADLGLAFAEDDPSITGTGGTLGTPHYISPEQAVDPRKADVRSDIWSFGATLFHALCGSPPFAGESAAEVLSGVLYARVPDPLELAPSLSKRLALVLRKCLTRDAALRYQNPHELLSDLELVRERRTPRVRRRSLDPVARAPFRRRRWLLLLAGAGVCLCAVVALRFGSGLAGETAEPAQERASAGPFAPLEEVAARLSRGEGTLAELRSELAALVPLVPLEERPRVAELEQELHRRLRRAVRTVQDEVEAELDRAIDDGDLAAAWERVGAQLDARCLRATGQRFDQLPESGVDLEPWRSRLVLELEAATDAAVSELEAALQDWRGARLAGVEARLAQHDWERALSALALGDDASVLREAGFSRLRLPAERVRGLVQDLRDEFRLRSGRIQEDWRDLDRELASFVATRRSTLERALRDGPPRIAAADMLRADFERELFDRGLTREQMPADLPRAGLTELERNAGELRELEEDLLEQDARAEFDEVEELGEAWLRERGYERVRGLWEEALARLEAGPRYASSPERSELARRMRVRVAEARVLQELLERVALRLSRLDGQRTELRWGAITYPNVLLEVGDDPLREGFQTDRIPGVLELVRLPSLQIEVFAGFASAEGALAPEERLMLALFRYHEGRSKEAQRALFSGPPPEDGSWREILSDLSDRIAGALEREQARTGVRESEAARLLESIFDAGFQAQSPRIVLARIARLLDDYEDLPSVRQSRTELLRLREKLEQPRASDEAEFARVYQPDELRLTPLGRVVLGFDFGEGRLGAWEGGDWVFDGLGFVAREAAQSWSDLERERGLRLVLKPPLDPDSFELTLRLEQPLSSGPPRLCWISAAGFQVALVGPGLAGTEKGGRFLVGTEEGSAFLRRLAAGDGERRESLLVAGGPPHELRFRAHRRAGRCELYLDGALLEQTSGLRAPSPEAVAIVVRSWEPVRLLAAAIEGGR